MPWARLILGTVAAVWLTVGAARAADPDALWKIVAGACVPHQLDGTGGTPCALVDLAGGFAVLKDRVGATQFLLIPTARVAGIESPEILAPDAPTYWQDAWQARRFVSERAGRMLARDEIGLAINSISGRSQNQLHIHIDCMRPEVRAALQADLGSITEAWRPLPDAFASHVYLARRLVRPDLANAHPFRLLAEGVAEAAADMAHETLVVTGTVFAGGQEGFVLLADRADPAKGDAGSGEELLDHSCALAHSASG
jgi:CDP-diacylglycerol pyrophosphatase